MLLFKLIISQWLKITGYYDLGHRTRTLARFRQIKALDRQRDQLLKEQRQGLFSRMFSSTQLQTEAVPTSQAVAATPTITANNKRARSNSPKDAARPKLAHVSSARQLTGPRKAAQPQQRRARPPPTVHSSGPTSGRRPFSRPPSFPPRRSPEPTRQEPRNYEAWRPGDGRRDGGREDHCRLRQGGGYSREDRYGRRY